MAWSQEDVDALTEPASSNENLKLINQSAMTEQEKVQMLSTKLSNEQWAALNVQIQYQTKKDPALKQDLEVAEAMGGRAQGRNVICAWVLDPTRGKCYQNMSMGLTMEQEWKQTEHWQVKSAYVLGKYTENEFRALINCGRMKWCEGQSCPGVFEYSDSADQESLKKVSKKGELEGRQSKDVLLETDEAAIFAEAMRKCAEDSVGRSGRRHVGRGHGQGHGQGRQFQFLRRRSGDHQHDDQGQGEAQ